MNKYIYLYILFFLLLTFINCSDMNDLHQKYLDEGEIIYSSKVDTIIVWTGHNRQQLEFQYSSRRTETGVIFWNDRNDSINFEFPQPYSEPLILMLPDMDEGDYTYELVTYDIYGNYSVPDEFNGKVYGERYLASLSNKMISESSIVTPDGINFETLIHFRQAENAIGMQLIYTNLKGEEVKLNIPNDLVDVRLKDNIPGKDFLYTTYFVPDSMCIDIFQCAYKTATFPLHESRMYLDRTDWEAIDFSSQEIKGEGAGNGVPSCLFDGDFNTFWHNQWDGAVAPLPHHVTIDLKRMCKFDDIEIYRRLDNTNTRKVIFEISDDNETYREIGEIDFGDSSDNSRILSVPATTGRFLKFRITESNKPPHASLSEIYLISEME